MALLSSRLVLLAVSTAVSATVAACQFSASAGGLDYDKLEQAITDELNSSYTSISRQVDNVECPRLAEAPKTGDTFVCTAGVDDNDVRVQVKVTDDDYNVDFSTMDTVFDLNGTAQALSREISEQQGFPVTVTCGEGLKVVEIGQSFDCVAADDQGATRTVRLTAGAVGENDHWELIEE